MSVGKMICISHVRLNSSGEERNVFYCCQKLSKGGFTFVVKSIVMFDDNAFF